MREILFRGKRVDNGEWVCGDLFNNYNDKKFIGELIINDYKGTACDRYEIGTSIVECIPSTVGQYTGLTDKNGKKIFEGDIVKGLFVFGEISSVVIFKYGSFGIEWNIDEIKVLDPFLGLRNIECEVIGNIHDNPELLKVGDENDT